MIRKTTVRIFQETSWQDSTWEDMDMAKEKKAQEKNGIAFNSSTK